MRKLFTQTESLIFYTMARAFRLLCLAVLTALFTGKLVKGERIRLSPDMTAGTELELSLNREQRTNYSLVIQQNMKFLYDFLFIDRTSGVLTLKRDLNCGIFLKNKMFVIAVHSMNTSTKLQSWTPIVISLHNKERCLEKPKMHTKYKIPKRVSKHANSKRNTREFSQKLRTMGNKPFLLERLGVSKNTLLNTGNSKRLNKDLYFNNRLIPRSITKLYDISANPRQAIRFPRTKRFTSNHPPKFPLRSKTVSIEEDVRLWSLVYNATATDVDYYQSGEIEYKMTPMGNIRSGDFFEIDPNTGVIRTKALLDRESMEKHVFRIIASDKGNPPLSDRMVLTIKLIDVNDYTPEFDKKVYREEISESEDIGSTVLAVRAHDYDEIGPNRDIRYSIVNGDGVNKAFIIDFKNGVITVHKKLDRETTASYHLVVKAQDQGTPPLNSTVDVFFVIKDENDCMPMFNESKYNFFVAEDSLRGTAIGTVNGTDCDVGKNQRIRYSFVSGNEKQLFQINTTSGVIVLVGSLDYEKESEYILQVMAEDSGTVPLFNEVDVSITIVDVNDNSPEFLNKEYYFKVSENKPTNVLVGTVQAQDADTKENQEINYSIRAKNIPFRVGAQTGKIWTTSLIDREATPRFRFQVFAKDKGKEPLESSVFVNIDVEDVNDVAPIFDQIFYNVTIDEMYRSSRPFTTVTASDKDTKGQINYFIRNDPTNCFSINSLGGITKRRSCRLDYKKKRLYQFKVGAYDGKRRTLVDVMVHVIDANNNSPKFTHGRYIGHIYENDTVGTIVTKVRALDDDVGKNAEITYSIIGRNSKFSINSKTGVITNLVVLDRERRRKYKLKILATDNGDRRRSGRAHVDVIVLDINDNKPKFDQSLYVVAVDEDARVGELVTEIKATDSDEGRNKRISYKLKEKGNVNSAFKINEDLGEITVNRRLDREVTPEYLLTVFATDHGQPPLNSTTQVKVTLNDIVDSPPEFESSPYAFSIPEDFPLNREILKIKAVTRDNVKDANILYDVTGGNYKNTFTILSSSGTIELAKHLDYEQKTSYRLTVQAIYASFLAWGEVHINVTNVNDNEPQLTENFQIVINVREGRFPSDVNFTVPAYDPDEDSQLSYDIVLNDDRLRNAVTVGKHTGVLKIKESALVNTNTIVFKVTISDGVHVISRFGSVNLNIITESILQASVPIYLKNATTSKFFALSTRFKKSLASMFQLHESSVIVFYLRNVTRSYMKFREGIGNVLHTDDYLTVWLAIRNGRNGFVNGQLLLENLFLNLTSFEKATEMIVLSSDKEINPGKHSNHFLLVGEACKTKKNSFLTCQINKTFVNGLGQLLITPFAVFYGVRAREVLKPVCSAGFYGHQCSRQLHACYSSPCHNNGKCINYEGGYYCACSNNFVGRNCEFDVSRTRCHRLPDGICKNDGLCRDLPSQGFNCLCKKGTGYGKFCDVNSRSFENGSFVAFTGLKQRWHIDISLEFATIESDGLLLYVGRYGFENDTMALELRNGHLYYVFSAGEDVQTVSVGPGDRGSITNGVWQKVMISYRFQIGAIVLGENCKTAVAVKFGEQVGSYGCAAAKKGRGKLRSMDLTSPLFLGGIPSSTPYLRGLGFNGCIRNVRINEVPLDMGLPIYNRNTRIGCNRKRNFCKSDSCSQHGTCVNTWDRMICVCDEGYAGERCEKATVPYSFTQLSYTLVRIKHVVIAPTLTISLVLRTVEKSGTLMQIVAANSTSFLEMVDAALYFTYNNQHLNVNNIKLADGKWHDVDIEFSRTSIQVVIDRIHRKVMFATASAETGASFLDVLLGDIGRSGSGFDGCIQGFTVNNVSQNISSASSHIVTSGCLSTAHCVSSSCPPTRKCEKSWRKTRCVCLPGYYGEKCEDICRLSPCQNGGTCQRTDDDVGFTCSCRKNFLGKYCERESELPCRDEFFSASNSGTCGPCNCATELEYNPVCNKTTGECYCKERYFRAFLPRGKLDDVCQECECDETGSMNDMCAPVGGQCPCLPGVIGRICDMCAAKQGEITKKGCEIINTSCPKSKSERINWPRESFGVLSKRKCPFGSIGVASRMCAFHDGWQDPDLSDCVSQAIVDISNTLKHYGNLTTDKAILISNSLNNILFQTKEFYQKDVPLAYSVILALLKFESDHSEDELASSQDDEFLDTTTNAVSTFVSPEYSIGWSLIKETPSATVTLMHQLEMFGISLASSMVYIKRKGYRRKRSTSNLLSYVKVEENMLMQLEPVDPKRFFGLTFPLEEHKSSLLSSERWRNTSNRVEIPSSLFENSGAPKDESAIAFIALKYLGDLLPFSFDVKESFSDLSLDVNSDVIIVGIKGMESLYLKEPIIIEFEIHEVNRSQYDCVFWNYSIPGSNGGGWSKNGCEKAPSNFTHTVCRCYHLTSFAVVSDLKIEIPVTSPYDIQLVTYVGVSISLVILLFVIFSFTCLSDLQSNTNSIHRNMVLAIVLAEVAYVFGINRTSYELICRFIAIILHYFFDAVFAWMFVETVHMYRRLTEKRDIDSGQMTFYYFLGWGCPAIVVGLSSGMAIEGYGNERFCWMTTSGTLFWTFTLPIVGVIFVNLIVFLMALRLSVQKGRKKRKPNGFIPKNTPVTSVYKNALKIKYALKVGALFIPVLVVTLAFAVLAVNEEHMVFHFLYAILCCCQSLFIFIFYVACDPKVREEYRNAFIRWRTGDKTYGRPRRRRLYEMSYHPGSNLAGEDGYGLKRHNAETSSTDRSSSTLHSSSMTRTSKTDQFSTLLDDEDSESDYREIKRRKPRTEDPINMEDAAKMWNAPEKSEYSTTQPGSSDSSDGRRRRRTMIISSDTGSSDEETASWEQKSENGVHKKKAAAPLYASDGPMHSTPQELERERASLAKKKPLIETPVSQRKPMLQKPSILKNSGSRSHPVPSTPQLENKAVPEMLKAGSEASSGSSDSSSSDNEKDLALQARLMSQSEGGISTLSSQSKKKRSRKSRDIKHGKTSRHQRVHFQRKKRDDSQNVPEDMAPEEGKLLGQHKV